MKIILSLSIFLLSCLLAGCATQSSVQEGAYSDRERALQIQQARADRLARRAIHNQIFTRSVNPLPPVFGNGTMPPPGVTNN